MSTPILYLHGVGETVRSGAWSTALDAALARHGLPPRRLREDLLVPDYVDLLRQGSRAPRTDPPPRTLDLARAALARGAYQVEQARVAAALPPHDGRQLVPTALYETGRHAWGAVSRSMRHVEHYRRHPHLRHGIARRVLRTLEGHDDLVLVGHSLGALVALDLLAHLPDGVRVRRLITLGSPAGWPSLHRGAGRTGEGFPYDRVGSWVNIHSPRDLVPLGRGSGRLFPAAVDVRTTLPPARHGAEYYVAAPVFGQVLAAALPAAASRAR